MLRSFFFILFFPSILFAQNEVRYQTDFPPEEFAARWDKIYDKIGQNIAIIQSAAEPLDYRVFRQSNDFYYLCGLETPNSYLVLDGRSRRATLYLPHRDYARERNEGKRLSAEDATEVREKTGVFSVWAVEQLGRDWVWGNLVRQPMPMIYTPFSPAEIGNDARDQSLAAFANNAADPWDGRPSREGWFIDLLKKRYPQLELKDLSPVLDEMRMIKSAREIELIRMASQLAAHGIVEAMRSTEVGVYEYQLEAAARYIFQLNGARREGYSAIVGGGKNAWMGHYFHNDAPLKDGDLVLLDYAPDYRYYTSDITRMWPVNGKFSAGQRELYGFIIAYRNALLKQIKPNRTSNEVMDAAADEMRRYIESRKWSKPEYEVAVRNALAFRGHLSHGVGMSVHDAANYRAKPLQKGMVFSVDPMIWIPEELLYIRMEEVVAVTESGVENFTDFMPTTIEEIEATMQETGIVQFRKALNPKE